MSNGRLKLTLMTMAFLLLIAATLSTGCIGGSSPESRLIAKAVFEMTGDIQQIKVVAITAEMWHNDSILLISRGGKDADLVDSFDIQINGFSCTDKTWQPLSEDDYDLLDFQLSKAGYEAFHRSQWDRAIVLNEDDCDTGLSISPNQRNHVIVVGHFTDGISQVLLDTYLKAVTKNDVEATSKNPERREGSDIPSGGIPYDFESLLDFDGNFKKIVREDRYVRQGESITAYADLQRGQNVRIMTHVLDIRDVIVQKPDGSIALHIQPNNFNYIWPTISVDVAGRWTVTVTRMTAEESLADFGIRFTEYYFTSLLLAEVI